ncbi:legumain-like [Hemitrygon akajei]|uniref:legumain-like n=1 Tax=Hemitrygon akajei TaxID=2704970 RepID=UPI003BF9DF4B
MAGMDAVPQCDVPVVVLQNRIKAATDLEQREKLQKDLDHLLKVREQIVQAVRQIVTLATDSTEQADRVLTAKLRLTERENYRAAVEHFQMRCFDWHKPEYEYALHQLGPFANLCVEQVPLTRIKEAIDQVSEKLKN